MKNAHSPCLSISSKTIPEAWEKAVLAVYHEGIPVRTEYDSDGDPPSLDATVMIEVREPFSEPRIHKNFPGGPQELEIYRQEVVEGIHNHWINPEDGKWTYTYHQRLFAYSPADTINQTEKPDRFLPVNQIEKMTDKLALAPYSRRAQAITWIPHLDPQTDDPPCLQRIWARLLPGQDGKLVLNFNSHWRSRDLYKAWFMNVFALTDLQKSMAQHLSAKMGKPVICGRYVDISDSLHIYGSYRDEALSNEIAKMEGSPYTDRAWDSSVMEPFFEEVRDNLSKDADFYSKGDQT